eukprot:3635777-Pleurochrysis_carterae.AAC.2
MIIAPSSDNCCIMSMFCCCAACSRRRDDLACSWVRSCISCCKARSACVEPWLGREEARALVTGGSPARRTEEYLVRVAAAGACTCNAPSPRPGHEHEASLSSSWSSSL